jgi:hypothetical protein
VSSDYLRPALIGGVTMGVLSALPVVSAGNLCCCLWVVAGGLLAAYLLQQDRPARITPGDGAIVGLLAGVIGAVVQLLLSIPIGLLVGPMERQLLQRVAELSGSMSPGMRDAFNGVDDGGPGRWFALLIFRTIAFFFLLTIGAMVSTVSGLIGAAIFGRDPQPRDIPSS